MFANDVVTAQTVEIGIMLKLHKQLPPSEPIASPVPTPAPGVRFDA